MDMNSPVGTTSSVIPPSPLSVDLATFPSPESSTPVDLSPPSPSTGSASTRRRNPSRIPRPRNAFIIFRSHTLSQRSLLPKSVEKDHRHISCIVGYLWKALSESEKDVYRSQADKEKVEHMEKYPNYRFEPNMSRVKLRRKVKRNGDGDRARCKKVAEFLMAGKRGEELNRAVKDLPNVQPVPPNISQPRKRSHKRVPKQDSVSTPSSPSSPSPPSPASPPPLTPSSSTSSSLSPPSSISTPITSPSQTLHGSSPVGGETDQAQVGMTFWNPLLPAPQQPVPNANIFATPVMDSLQPPSLNPLSWQQGFHNEPYYPPMPAIHDQGPMLFRNDAPLHFTTANNYETSPDFTHPNHPSLPMYNNDQTSYAYVVGDVQMPIMFSPDPVGWHEMLTVNPQMLNLGMGNMNLDMDNAYFSVA